MTEWNASEYDRLSALQATMAEEVLSLLKLEGSERILDIGCGNGKTTAEIAARVPQGSVTGVDASAEMVAFAKDHWIPAHPNLQFAVADARHLPFEQRIRSHRLLQRAALDPRSGIAPPAIRTCHQSERHRATAVSAEGPAEEHRRRDRGNPPFATLVRLFQGFQDPYLHLTPEQYAELAEQQGFRVVSLHTADKAWDFQSRATFEALSKVTMIEWTQHVPEAERPAFIADVLDRYQHVAAQAPGEENFFRFYQMDIVLTPK